MCVLDERLNLFPLYFFRTAVFLKMREKRDHVVNVVSISSVFKFLGIRAFSIATLRFFNGEGGLTLNDLYDTCMIHNLFSNFHCVCTIIQVVHTEFIKNVLTEYSAFKSLSKMIQEQAATVIIIALIQENSTDSFEFQTKAALTLNDLYDTTCMIQLVWLCKIVNSYKLDVQIFAWYNFWKIGWVLSLPICMKEIDVSHFTFHNAELVWRKI